MVAYNYNLLPKTVVFVDYESWFWGMFNKYGEKPNLNKFIKDIKQQANLQQIYFFGDFTKEEMQKERTKLRTITNNIIDCANQENKKDYTDFIMLDHIYRTILQNEDIEQYVLVTGDGHFHSVVAYLKTFQNKTVGVYGVHGSLSKQLRECATWSQEIMPETSVDLHQKYALKSILWAEIKNYVPTFKQTVEKSAEYFGQDKPKINASLSRLIEKGYITQVMKRLPNGVEIRALETNWDLLKKHEIFDASEETNSIDNKN